MKRVIKIEKNGANGELAKTVNTRSISKYSFVEETDFCSFLSESSDGYQF